MQISRTLSGTLLVAGAATLWGINGTVSLVVMDAGLSPSRLVEARITCAALILLIWVLVRERGALRLTGRELVAYASFGVIGLVGVQWFYYEAINRIPIGVSLVIEYSAPLLVALWVRFVWGRHLPLFGWLAIPIALLGLALVLGVGSGSFNSIAKIGIVWSVAASLCYAYYALHAERLTRQRSAVAVLAIGLAMGSIALAIALPWWSFPWHVLTVTASTAPIAVATWVWLLFVVIFGTVLPFAMLLSGVRRVGADGATVTAMLEPIIASAVAWMFLSQALSLPQMLGGVIVLSAVTVAQVSRARAAFSSPS